MILLIDNYDSFTYNLFQYISEQYAVVVVRNDNITVQEIEDLEPEAIIISPGPGLPDTAGICIEVVERFHKTIPILGVCLGHQAIGMAFGSKLRAAKEIKHGKSSLITHHGIGLFNDLQSPEEVMRYHSFVISHEGFPDEFEITAISIDTNEIMAIKHKQYPVYGLQFHPESIGTPSGKQMIKNFLNLIKKESVNHETVS